VVAAVAFVASRGPAASHAPAPAPVPATPVAVKPPVEVEKPPPPAPAPAPKVEPLPAAQPPPAPAPEPAPAPPPEPAKLTLRITPDPSAAEVFADENGARFGATPLQVQLPVGAGEVSFVVRSTGYAEARVTFKADADGEQHVVLKKRPSPPRPAAPAAK